MKTLDINAYGVCELLTEETKLYNGGDGGLGILFGILIAMAVEVINGTWLDDFMEGYEAGVEAATGGSNKASNGNTANIPRR